MRVFMELNLEMVVKAFATWRATRISRVERTPDELKEMVKELHPILGPKVLCKALGISRRQLENMVLDVLEKSSSFNPKAKESSNDFAVASVELPSSNQSAELILQKGQNSLTVKLAPNQLQNCLSMMANLL